MVFKAIVETRPPGLDYVLAATQVGLIALV